MNSMALFDFSGDLGKWGPGCTRSNVWVAESELDTGGQLRLLELRRVQGLPGAGLPFERLTSHIRTNGFAAVAIDAPFSVPAEYVPEGSHERLLRLVANFGRSHDRAPFARGAELVRALLPRTANARGLKTYRKTERFWVRRGIQVRSTLWNGPRGGAPFTVACLTLLQATALPIWPWHAACDDANRNRTILTEAFPAAQLCTWDLPFVGYGKDNSEQRETRVKIIDGLRQRSKLMLSQSHADVMVASPDALDAVICIYAAKAALNCNRRWPEHHDCFKEGLIAVHQ
jgi:hypothetical protein